MLPLADCCASLEALLPDVNQGDTQLAWQRLRLAGEVSRVSMQLLAALSSRLRSGATAPSLDLIQRLALSASVPVRWWPKALRAAADEELGQSTQPEAPLCRPELLQMAEDAATVTIATLRLMNHQGPHIEALRTTLCTPAVLASTLGNLAAVYAQFARFPATFKDQAEEWIKLAVLAANLLDLPSNAAVAAAVEEDRDVQQQLAAALLPCAAHLLEVADISSTSWVKAWAPLVAALSAKAVWPDPEACLGEVAQLSAAVREGLVHLLRMLPPLDVPPKTCRHAWNWVPAALNTARAAAVATTKPAKVPEGTPQGQVQQVAVLRAVQQEGFRTLLALLPITVDLLAAAAEQLPAYALRKLLAKQMMRACHCTPTLTRCCS